MGYTFCVDFGSTFTKLCVLDLENGEIVTTARQPTTVGTDASLALRACLREAEKRVGKRAVDNGRFLTSSSAAGGLRMVVVGLTRRFSLLAGKNAALGAGARIIKTYENRLQPEDIEEIQEINPEVLLLCGGVEGGNTDRILHNTAMLKRARLSSYILYGGNQEIASYVRQELAYSAAKCYFTENVFPSYGKVNGGPAGEIIRQLFMERISGAKGLAPAFPFIGSVLMPTPAAVLRGGRLLSRGTAHEKGMGSLLLVDVGGATTDIYSFAENTANTVKSVGAPEPFSKRTVEGDLGVRSSCQSLLASADTAALADEIGISSMHLMDACRRRAENGTYVADCEMEQRIDTALAAKAVELGVRRHCGRMVSIYGETPSETVEGKDLTEVRTIAGTGGPIIHSRNPGAVLEKAVAHWQDTGLLLPKEGDYYLDKSYILYAAGLCEAINPDGALHIAKESMTAAAGR